MQGDMQTIIFIFSTYLIITHLTYMPACLTQLMQTLKIEENICIQNKIEEKFFKFHFIYDNVQNNNESNACHYICMTQCKLPEII